MSDRPRAFDLWVLAPLGLAVLAYQLAEPGEAIPPLAMVACIIGRVVQDLTGWVLGRASIAAAVLVAVLYVIADVARQDFQVTTFADFMMVLGALKAFEKRTPRDDGQLLVVSIFIALSAAVSSNRMGTGVLLVVYVFALMLAVMRVQIDAAMWPAQNHRRSGLWKLLAGCAAGSTMVAVVAFVLLPRSNERFAPAQLSPITQSVSGFRESVRLGTGGLISQDRREVMRISAVDRLGETTIGFEPGQAVYLRGRALTEYGADARRGEWTAVEDAAQVYRSPVREDTKVSVGSASDFRTIKVVQHAGASNVGTVFMVWRPVRVRFELATGDIVLNETDSSMRFAVPPGDTIEYHVTFGVGPPDSPARAAEGRAPPSGVQVIAERARRILVEAGIEPDRLDRPVADDADAVRAIESWLRSTKSYTLDIEPARRDVDPTAWFIEEGTRGHCEYFASALALLCRDVGIHARVVTGYLAVADSADEDFIRVRRSDAHAWVEAEIEPGVWETFDATPAASLNAGSSRASLITRWLGSLESAWLTSFISYDARAQSSLSRSIDRAFNVDRLRASGDETGGTGNFARRWVPVVGGLLVSAGCVIAIVRLRRRRAGSATESGYGVPQPAILARDAVDAEWTAAEIPRPRGVSLVRHASAVDPARVAEVEDIERLAFGSE